MGVLGVTARKLERWRQADCLPQVEQRSLGRAGTTVAWPPGTASQVAAMAAVLTAGVSLTEAPFALFYLGFPMGADTLRDAYTRHFANLVKEIDKITDGSDPACDPLDRADALAQTMARRAGRNSSVRRLEPRLRRAIRQRRLNADGSARVILADVLAVAASGLLAGQAGSHHGVADALTIFGLNDGQDIEQTGQVLASINVDAMVAAITLTTTDQWNQARTDSRELSRYIRTRAAVESALIPDGQRLSGLDDFTARLGKNDITEAVAWAPLMPVLLIIGTPGWRAELAKQQAQFDAVALMLTVIPERFHHLLGLDHDVMLGQATEAQKSEVISIVSEWAKQYPDQAERIQAVFGTDDTAEGRPH